MYNRNSHKHGKERLRGCDPGNQIKTFLEEVGEWIKIN